MKEVHRFENRNGPPSELVGLDLRKKLKRLCTINSVCFDELVAKVYRDKYPILGDNLKYLKEAELLRADGTIDPCVSSAVLAITKGFPPFLISPLPH